MSLIYKVVAWRLISIISMLLTLWFLTGDIGKSTGVTMIVQAIQTIVHAGFETFWRRFYEIR